MARLRVRAADLGLPAPPHPLRLAFQVRENRVAVLVQAPGAAAGPTRDWVETLGPGEVIERGDDDLVHMWAIFEPVPKRWADIVNLFELRTVHVRPDGGAEVALVGSRDDVHRTIEGTRFSGVEVLGVETIDARGSRVLTGRQEEATRAALRAGYYEVPRGLSLTELADRLDVSPSALSELLRRAEGRALAHLMGEALHETGTELGALGELGSLVEEEPGPAPAQRAGTAAAEVDEADEAADDEAETVVGRDEAATGSG